MLSRIMISVAMAAALFMAPVGRRAIVHPHQRGKSKGLSTKLLR
jgi:hypothetical protein